MLGVLYLLFFLSGISGLVYQVIWVREFGNVFGNTVYSTSIVLAIFMLGLGVGSFVVGAWADRRYSEAPHDPRRLLRAYGYVELLIAALGLAISLVLPSLGALSAALSSYTTDAAGWNVPSPLSYIGRAAIAVMLLAPITLLMGGTLTLLIRHLVRANVSRSGWTIALLYSVNTMGAAAGAFFTDFLLVPATGLQTTQIVAVVLNLAAGAGALWLATQSGVVVAEPTPAPKKAGRGRQPRPAASVRADEAPKVLDPVSRQAVLWTALAIGLSGLAAMGMEILWLRHFNLLLGGFRAVFSLLITVVLLGMGIGALAGGMLARRTSSPARALMVVQALFVATSLAGIGLADIVPLQEAGAAIESQLRALSPWRRTLIEFWYNARPMLREVLVPALLMGCAFPLANAIIQRAELVVGRRAGLLYLANTAGAVLGSLIAGYVLLPSLGIQGSAAVLAIVAAAALVPLFLTTRGALEPGAVPGPFRLAPAAAGAVAVIAIGAWFALPSDLVLRRSQTPVEEDERILTISEGISEIIAVVEVSGRGRGLITNGHPMSSTAVLDQRYMRAMAHIPLLMLDAPERALVIGFGVGNTTHAASLHPSMRQVDVADLSRHILEHAPYFRDAHGDILASSRVKVYVNDGRQHLLMMEEGTYDLVTLEPPPIAYAGVGSLYSREFYELARTRLKPGGFMTQWLPAYQVPAETSLAMIRAFIDVFPQTVLLSGSQAELLLVGTTGPSIQVDPRRLERALASRPDVLADLSRLDLGTVTEIIGSFVGSSTTLALATRDVEPVTDDRPMQEYGVRSALGSSLLGVPAAIVNLGSIADWCPACFDGDDVTVPALDTYLALMFEAYTANAAEVAATVSANPNREIIGSRYLGSVLPESPAVYSAIGTGLVRAGNVEQARAQFAAALQLDPEFDEAKRGFGEAQYVEGRILLEQGQYAAAIARFRDALGVIPDSPALHNDIGIALAASGDLAQAREHFRQAVALDPEFTEAQQNLERAGGER